MRFSRTRLTDVLHLRCSAFRARRRRLSLICAVLDRASKGWRGVGMTPTAVRRLQTLRRELITLPDRQHDKEAVDDTVTAAA